MNALLKYAYMFLICGKYRQQWSMKKFVLTDNRRRRNRINLEFYSSQNYLHINSILPVSCAEEEESSIAEV